MNADITVILDNVESAYFAAQTAARDALDNAGFDREPDAENHEPDYYYETIGHAVRDSIAEAIEDITDKPNTLAGLMLQDYLSEVDWREVGEHYYENAASDEE